MTTKPTTDAMQEIYFAGIDDLLRALKTEKDPNKVRDIINRAIKSDRIKLLGDSTNEALKKILSLPSEKAADTLATIVDIAKGLATDKKELQKEAAKRWAQAYAKSGDSISGISSIANLIATVARYFGANDFADEIEVMAKAELQRAKQYYIAPTEMVTENGVQIATNALQDAIKLIKSTNPELSATLATTDLARAGENARLPDPYAPAAELVARGAGSSGSAQPSGAATRSSGLTKPAFLENARSIAGITPQAVEQAGKDYDAAKGQSPASDKSKVDAALEYGKLMARIQQNKFLSQDQQRSMMGYVEKAASEGP